MRIAVLGGNGQVGAEVCLILARQPGVDVIPVCRNRFGSAFLRFHGLACRHGEPTDRERAPALYGDCDVVVVLSLASLVPDYGAARTIHDGLIRNVAECAAPFAKLIYFSTQSVYGDAHVGQRVIFRDLYGHEKYRCEKLARRQARRRGRALYIFRLGHVCGELQGDRKSTRLNSSH